jgi:hypothetical protein
VAFSGKDLFIKYKLLHIIMWLLVCIYTFFTYYNPDDSIWYQAEDAVSICLVSMILFYTTAYILVPQFLYKKKFFVLIAAVILLIVVFSFISVVLERLLMHYYDNEVPVMPEPERLGKLINYFVGNHCLFVFCAGALRVLTDRFSLEKEKISTELNFLRSQVNPHFLFNVMNTIYFQIDKENKMARASVEKFSDMLRYQLYECTTDKIEIEKEILYIKNYVAIQTLRFENGTDIKLDTKGQMKGFKIAPLLILPIVENAFKHVSHFKEPALNKIYILLQKEGDHFIIDASNTYDKNSTSKELIHSGGLGIQNVQRRLELLYPASYEFETKQNENFFHTLLKIKIS